MNLVRCSLVRLLASLALALAALLSTGPSAGAQELSEFCGTLVSVGPFCPSVLEIDNGLGYLVVADHGGFQNGTRVHVTGFVQSCDTTCPTGACMLSNTIELCTAPCSCTSYCFGDGSSLACPCGNLGAPGYGCANSAWATGAALSVAGGASLSDDTLVLWTWNAPTTLALYAQGTAAAEAVFGDGKLCLGGTQAIFAIKRSGGSHYPKLDEPRISVVGQVMSPGSRYYQIFYRDPASFCTGATFNSTNAVAIRWLP